MQRRHGNTSRGNRIVRTEQLECRRMMTLPPDRFEPNDNFNQWAYLGEQGDDTEANLTIDSPGNQDFYRFAAAHSGNYNISILFTHAQGDLDLALYSDSNAPLARSDGTTDNEHLSFFLTAGTAYKINVAGFNGATNTYTLVIDDPAVSGDPAPAVESSSFGYLTSQKVTLNFSEDVLSTLDASDLSVVNTTTSQAIPTAAFSYSESNANTGKTTGVWSATSLPDGNYTATLPAGSVHDGANQPNNEYSFGFFVWRGDADHNRTVDLTDFTLLAANFNGTGKNFGQGDFDYNSTVDLTDFTILAGKFNSTLAPAAAPAATPLRASTPPPAAASPIHPLFSANRVDTTTAASELVTA